MNIGIPTVLLSLALGAAAGDLSARRSRSRRSRRSRPNLGELRRLHRVAARAALGDSPDDLTLQVCAELIDLLSLRDCWFEDAPFLAELPRLEPDGALNPPIYRWTGEDVALPNAAASIVVELRGEIVGRFVLATTPDAPVALERRLVACALADQLRVALAARAA